jgi:peptidoglycan/LPS O-acetylase OafA/YrhL
LDEISIYPQQAMNNQEFDNTKGSAKWALALFIMGILGAILICAHDSHRSTEAMQFALLLLVFIVICEVLALVFGLVGWRHTAGKVAVVGAVAVGIVGLAALFSFWPPGLATGRATTKMKDVQMPGVQPHESDN